MSKKPTAPAKSGRGFRTADRDKIILAAAASNPGHLTIGELLDWIRLPEAERVERVELNGKVEQFVREFPAILAELKSAKLREQLERLRDEAEPAQLLLPASGPLRAIISALNNRHRLKADDSGSVTHRIATRRLRDGTAAAIATVEFRDSVATRTVDEFLRFLKDAPETTVDVLIITMTWWRERRDGAGGAFITADQILNIRGIKPKRETSSTAGWRAEDLVEIAHAMAMLDSSWLTLTNTIAAVDAASKRRKARDVHNSRFLAVLDHKTRTVDGKLLSVGWRYSFGEWVQLYPFDQYFAVVSRALVGYHAFRMRWERRLGLYGVLHLSLAEPRTVERDIRSVLEHAGLLDDVDERHPERTVRRLRKALNQLVADGHFRRWKIAGHADATLDAYLTKHLPARSWWSKFEQLKLTIEGQSSNGPLFEPVGEARALSGGLRGSTGADTTSTH